MRSLDHLVQALGNLVAAIEKSGAADTFDLDAELAQARAILRVTEVQAGPTLEDAQVGDVVARWHYYHPGDRYTVAVVTGVTKSQIRIGADKFWRADGRILGGFWTDDSIKPLTEEIVQQMEDRG